MTLSAGDLIHFLCLHGAKHAWGRLNWLADLVWFGHRYPNFDWTGLLEHAAQSGTRRMTLVGLALARELWDMPLPSAVLQQLETDPRVQELARWMWQRVLRGTQSLATGVELVQLIWRSRERGWDRARDLYHQLMAMRPNNLEDVSPAAAALRTYPLHRLVYLVRKYSVLKVL
jgi:hypothetical protein